MTANERKGPRQSKLSAWQSLQPQEVTVETSEVNFQEIEPEIEEHTEVLNKEPKVELKPITKKPKTKTDGTEG